MIKRCIKENIWYIISIILLIIIFVVVKNTSIYDKILEFDYKVIEFFSNRVDDRFTALFKYVTNFGDWYIPITIIVCTFIFLKNKMYSYVLATNYAFVGIVAYITKFLVARPRPLNALINLPLSHSFPSGHTLTSIGFFMIFWYLITRKSNNIYKILLFSLFIVLIFFVGLSRIYLGVHYFSDVLGGIILSIPCVLMSINVINKCIKEKLK